MGQDRPGLTTLGGGLDFAAPLIVKSRFEVLLRRAKKHGAGHLRGSQLSSLFKHFLGGIEKAQKRNFSIVSNINIIIIIIIIIIRINIEIKYSSSLYGENIQQ